MQEKTNNNPLLISFLTLRKCIGFLGIFLPVVLLAGTFLIGSCTKVQDSISHYYFTIMGDVFVGVLCSVALFLLAYKGYDKKDNIATNLAGIFAIGIAFFPTTENKDVECALRTLPPNPWIHNTHYICAALFFTTTACISFFLFTKSDGKKKLHSKKEERNYIYKICGVIMFIAIISIGIIHATGPIERFKNIKPVFVLEWLALLAFGISWIVKGEFILKDE